MRLDIDDVGLASVRVAVLLIPSYTVAYLTEAMHWTMPTLAAAASLAASLKAAPPEERRVDDDDGGDGDGDGDDGGDGDVDGNVDATDGGA